MTTKDVSLSIAKDLSDAHPDKGASPLDIAWVRSQFPLLSQTVNGHPAVFLMDNVARRFRACH